MFGNHKVVECILSLTLFFAITFSAAADFEPFATSAKGQGMGGALPTPKSIDSLIYNPAGLATMQQTTMAITSTNLYDLGITQDYIAGATKINNLGIGAAYYCLSDPDLDYTDQVYQLGIALPLTFKLRVGGSFKLGVLDSIGGRGKALLADAGLIWQPVEAFELGMAANNFLAKANYEEGEELPPARSIAVGVTLHPYDGAMLTMNIPALSLDIKQNELQFGLEKWYSPQFCVRLGYASGNLTAGLTLHSEKWDLDYAYLNHPLGATNLLVLKMNFGRGVY